MSVNKLWCRALARLPSPAPGFSRRTVATPLLASRGVARSVSPVGPPVAYIVGERCKVENC